MQHDSEPKPGLRLRKKRETENAIEMAAVRLALEHGLDHVTVEMICEQADISRSTFFNYFAGRDYAIVGRAIKPLTGEAAAAVLGANEGSLVHGIVSLVFASIGHQHVNTDVARKRAQLNAEQPAALQLASAILAESSMKLIPVIIDWLVQNPARQTLPDPVQEATLAGGLAHAAIASLLAEMARHEGDVLTNDEHLNEILDQMRLLLG